MTLTARAIQPRYRGQGEEGRNVALVIAGRVAPGAEEEHFTGRVWLGDDGLVDAVTRRDQRAPSGFGTAPVVEVGEAVVHPGFVDLHSHLGYNTLNRPGRGDTGPSVTAKHPAHRRSSVAPVVGREVSRGRVANTGNAPLWPRTTIARVSPWEV